jgi:hypothetical protein
VKTLFLDIETMPHLMWGFDMFNQNFSLEQVHTPGWVACFSYMWDGQKKASLSSEKEIDHDRMIEKAHELLEQADVVVHFNGDRFDIPHLNWEFIQAGLGPPAPSIMVDLRKTVKARFRPMSGKLQHIVQQLDIGTKVNHDGFPLWRGWMEGNEKDIRLMHRYAKRDTELLKPLFDAFTPWIPQLPNVALFEELTGLHCRCGSTNLHKRGFSYTPTAKRQRYQCQDCGTWLTSGKAVHRVDLRGTR